MHTLQQFIRVGKGPCRGCGKEVLFARLEDGTLVPLDVHAVVYQLDLTTRAPTARRAQGYYVSHFATCIYAGRFGAARKKAGEGTC